MQNLKIENNAIGLISYDDMQEMISKRDIILSLAKRNIELINESSKICTEISAKNFSHFQKYELFFIKKMNKDYDLDGLEKFLNGNIWQSIMEKSGLYIYMDNLFLKLWNNKLSQSDFPKITIENIGELFNSYFSKIKEIFYRSVKDLLFEFEFYISLPNKIILRNLIDKKIADSLDSCDCYYDYRVYDYFNDVELSKLNKLYKIFCILDDNLQEKYDIKNDLILKLKAGENEWECKYFSIHWEQQVGFLNIFDSTLFDEMKSIFTNKSCYFSDNDVEKLFSRINILPEKLNNHYHDDGIFVF